MNKKQMEESLEIPEEGKNKKVNAVSNNVIFAAFSLSKSQN